MPPDDSPLNPQSSPIKVDLPCANCRYNLRTLLPSARCPECNHPVADSIIQFQKPAHNFRRISLAAATLALPNFITCIWIVFANLFPSLFNPRLGLFLYIGLDVFAFSLTAAAIFLLATSTPIRPRSRIPLLAIALIPTLINYIFHFIMSYHFYKYPFGGIPFSPPIPSYLLAPLACLDSLTTLILYFFAARFFIRIARRYRQPWLFYPSLAFFCFRLLIVLLFLLIEILDYLAKIWPVAARFSDRIAQAELDFVLAHQVIYPIIIATISSLPAFLFWSLAAFLTHRLRKLNPPAIAPAPPNPPIE